MREYKCYGTCEGKYTKDNLVQISNKNYCKKCAAEFEKNKKDRDVLYKTIQTVFQVPYPTGLMLRQMKQFKQDRGYTYEGMTKTICYFIKVMKKSPSLKGNLSFLPYYYDSSIKYYEDLEERRNKVNEMESVIKVVNITIAPKEDNSEYRTKKIIDMNGLLSDG